MLHATPARHHPSGIVARCWVRVYRRAMARTNLLLSDDLFAIVQREAAKAGITEASYIRECVAWRIGRLEADQLEQRLGRIERKLGLNQPEVGS